MGLDKNNTVLISEEYVTDPKQWADPEKILERELNVPFN
jgi:hypothetical protein